MMAKKTKADFVWSDDEIQLLLKLFLSYKSTYEYEGIHWESLK